MEWKTWPYVLFTERQHLPSDSGIYVVVDSQDFVWYVGQAKDLKNRWMGRTHHRYAQLIRSHRKLTHTIYWKPVPILQLDEFEQYYINLFKPELNYCKVKTYLPKQPQVIREIKRLLKVLNKPNSLFPVIRSVVSGEYINDENIKCIIIIITINDWRILYDSSRKSYANEVKKAWIYSQSYCGKDEEAYNFQLIQTYCINEYRIEFVEEMQILSYLANNPEAYERYVGVAELFDVSVKVLKDLSLLPELSLEHEHNYLRNGKKNLTRAAYLHHRHPQLKCLNFLTN
jgi:hypothetical protein